MDVTNIVSKTVHVSGNSENHSSYFQLQLCHFLGIVQVFLFLSVSALLASLIITYACDVCYLRIFGIIPFLCIDAAIFRRISSSTNSSRRREQEDCG